MKTVVSSINYDDLWGHDGTWACSHSTTTVPDETDLSYKADKVEVTRMYQQLQSLLLNNKNLLVSLEEKQACYVEKHVFENFKTKLLDATRLKEEHDFIVKVGTEILEKIKSQCDIERKAITKEIQAFSKIDINGCLQSKLLPINDKLSEIIRKIDYINSKAQLFEQRWKEIDRIYNDYEKIKKNIEKCSESIVLYKTEYAMFTKELQSYAQKYKNAIQQISTIQIDLQNNIRDTTKNQVQSMLTSLSFWKRIKWLFLGHF